MKKGVLLLFGFLCSFYGHAQYIERLSNQEIIECKTPASVAYNYTIALLQKDFDKMLRCTYLTPHEVQEIEDYLQESGETYETLYSQMEDVVALWSWLPALKNGYEVAIAGIEDLWLAKTDGGWMVDPDQIVKDGMVYIPGEEKPYLGIHELIVYVTCSPSSEINTVTFNNLTRYKDSILKVNLHNNDGKWLVQEIHFINQFKQALIEGEWFLHEIQIPSYESYSDDIIVDNLDHIVLRPLMPPISSEDVDAFMKEFEASYQEAVASLDSSVNNGIVDHRATDSLSYDEVIHDLYVYSGIEYEIFRDTVLVLYFPENYPGIVYQNEVYVIKELTKDRLVMAHGRNLYGYMLYIYGREKQPIKRTKHYYSGESLNPIVQRLSHKDLQENTPAAVAYNFVTAILNNSSQRMLSYMDPDVADEFESTRLNYGYADYSPFFSESGDKLNILGWKDYLPNNAEVAVLYVQSEWFDERGREIKKVYVGCVPSAEVGRSGFQDITRYGGTNVKVLVVNEDDNWRVVGFK